MLQFEWDEEKNKINQLKHKISLQIAITSSDLGCLSELGSKLKT